MISIILLVTATALQNFVFSSVTTVQSEENLNQDDEKLIPEKTKMTYYVYWMIKQKKLDNDNPFFAKKNVQYVFNISIPHDNLKSISFKLTWKDDLTFSLFGFGKDKLTFSIKSPDDIELYKKQSIGEDSLEYIINDINQKPSINQLIAENISDAENKVTRYYNSKWKNMNFKISVYVKIGEIGLIRRFLDKGNNFNLEVSYQYYYSDILDVEDKPSNTKILTGPIGNISSHNVTFSWIGSDDFTPTENLKYSYRLSENEDWSDWTKETSVTYGHLPENKYTFFVKSQDHRKNIDPTPAQQSFVIEIVDNTPPNTTLLSGPDEIIHYNDVIFKWAGSDDFTSADRLQYSYTLEGKDTKWSDWSSANSKKYLNLENGEYIFKVKARDEKGNIDPTPAQQYFKIYSTKDDKNPPDTEIISGPSGIINYSSVTITWRGIDDITPLNQLRYSFRLIGQDSSWSEWTTSTSKYYQDLKNGEYVFEVKSRDQAGNIDPAPAQLTFVVDAEYGPNRFATSVIEVNFGDNPHPAFMDPLKTLGGPRGLGDTEGSLDVLSLGVGGNITFGFDVTIKNDPGEDFIVFENPFYIFSNPEKVYAELMYVEVSTDGINFARFPSISNSNESGSIYPEDVENLAGVYPVYANVDKNNIDPFDPEVAGGDAFDLNDLLDDPLVESGFVDLDNVHYIRLIDILGDGSCLDSRGLPIYDPIDMDNGADLDAVAIINYEE